MNRYVIKLKINPIPSRRPQLERGMFSAISDRKAAQPFAPAH